LDWNLAKWVEDGGVFMWPILACGVLGAAISAERVIFLFLRASIHAQALMAQIQRDVLAGDYESALKVCNAESAAVLPRVLKAGLLRAGRPENEVRDALEEATLEVTPLVQQRIPYMTTIANLCTLLGLLGTIQGLILSFHAVAEASAEARSTALASGIAVAMNATFAGLLVAIPVLAVHSVVAARANRILDEVDYGSARLMNLLNAVKSRGEGPPTSRDLE
jgi:biopolymer transport protein ExbB/TolQ